MKMTVKDLIQKLLECPLNTEVHVHEYYPMKGNTSLKWCYVSESSGEKIVILEN